MTRGPARLVGPLLAALAGLAGAAAARDRAVEPPPVEVEATARDTIRYSLRVTDNNLMGITITNYGFVGNNFVSRAPSLEYPLGSGFEHLVRGGLWVGGEVETDTSVYIGVTTAAVDGAHGSGSQAATEFTPAGLEIAVRSTLPNSRHFSPLARSEQDLISLFRDPPTRRAANNNENHKPMNILVRQENYSWSFADFQHFIVFRYVIENRGKPLRNAWVGFYAEFASGPKPAYSTWPPSSSGSSLGSWYSKKYIAYDDSLRLFREHYCAALPFPGGCNLGLVPYWIGIKLLGIGPGSLSDPDKRVTLAAWSWAPGSSARDEDTERYALMSAGRIQDLSAADLQPQSGDPVELLAVGPFAQIDPGDSVTVDFAIVGGAEIADITRHAGFAQRAFDRNYIVPVPPPSPGLKVVARHRALDLYWDDEPESAVDSTSSILRDFEGYRVYVGEDRLRLDRVAQFDLARPPHDTTGFNTGLEAARLPVPEVIDGKPYAYKHTVGSLRDGFKYFAAVTAYDLGSSEIQSLESGISQNKTMAIPAPGPGERVGGGGVTVFPNPYRVEARWDRGRNVRDHYLWFANLPERCALKIFTLAGDLVFETDFDGGTYRGEGARGIYDPASERDVPPPTLSGRTFGWNLITREGQAVATGLYLYAVEDRATGERSVGKFLLVKSDREGF